jgi:hypothetical protein
LIKKQLSSNLLAEKIIIALVLIITLPSWFFVSEFPAISIFLVLILIFCGYSLYTIYFVVSNLYYDNLYLYIKSRKQDKVIELKDIIQIKITPYFGSWRTQWKIKYIENNREEFVFFYLKYGLFSLTPFIKLVKTKNPTVDCVYITLDIDFD